MLHSRRQRSTARFLPACCAGVLVLLVALSSAQSRPLSLIRDAEIETIIGAYATPLFAAARLDPAAVEIKIVKSRDINAFVAGGQRIFIFTGLLLAADHPDEIKAVIAHEGTIDYFVDSVTSNPTLAECYPAAALNGINRLGL